jgi:hypothetical protein
VINSFDLGESEEEGMEEGYLVLGILDNCCDS